MIVKKPSIFDEVLKNCGLDFMHHPVHQRYVLRMKDSWSKILYLAS